MAIDEFIFKWFMNTKLNAFVIQKNNFYIYKKKKLTINYIRSSVHKTWSTTTLYLHSYTSTSLKIYKVSVIFLIFVLTGKQSVLIPSTELTINWSL